ncbi:hypothetical protein [Faecalibacillus intestinalis]|uniref:hypothetical protein n=1 Tax=Faecalibacillus intestinalis TaxID=1982626 RepID=UPI0039904053
MTVVLYLIAIFWIVAQLYLLKNQATISYIFLIGDIILGLILLFVAWINELMEERKVEDENYEEEM